MNALLRTLIVTSFLASTAFAAELSNVEKCNLEHQNHDRIQALIESYQKTCGHLPIHLEDLIRGKSACKKWTADSLEDNAENHELLKGYSFSAKTKPFRLVPMDCPN